MPEDLNTLPPCPTCSGTTIRVSVHKRQTNLVTRQHACTGCGRRWKTALPRKLPVGVKVPRHTYTGACHYCPSQQISTVGTRHTGTTIERYHDCPGCGAHFRSAEFKKKAKGTKDAQE